MPIRSSPSSRFARRAGFPGAARRFARSLLLLALAAGVAMGATGAAYAHGPTGVVADRVSIGGLRVGDSLARAKALWQQPDWTHRRRGVVSYRWRNNEGVLAYVRARGGRIIAIEVQGPVFRTRRGDGYGTRLADFRRRWPETRRYRDCCAVGVTHYAVPARRAATLLVFTFVPARGLTQVAMTTSAHFRACYVSECD